MSAKIHLIVGCYALAVSVAVAAEQPNIVAILTDDQGYADISYSKHAPKEVSTPHMDALARAGVVFTQAYLSGNVCSPTRAGLMLGQYQQRVGIYTAGEGGRGFDPKRQIFPGFLPETYVSAALGKWHLGLDSDYPALKWNAVNRGFDEFYGFMGRGGHDYFDLSSDSVAKMKHPIYRNKKRINDEGYLTTRLTEEAVAFIERQKKEKPFFLYLAYNAVHSPAQAPAEDIAKIRKQFPELPERRAILMAMLRHLDDGVGEVVKSLKKTGAWDNTLLFFLTDNGGARAMSANNSPLRGFKGQVYEGGIRTPFIVSWPQQIKGGREIHAPISSLDLLPTVLDALAVSLDKHAFDGKSLLPLMHGKTDKHHESLFWSEGASSGEWAIRSGAWKLIGIKDQRELYHLDRDPSEKRNLIQQEAEKARELETRFDQWLAMMADPQNGAAKKWDRAAEETQKTKAEQRAARRAARDAERAKRRSERRSE